jgi:hypothetical protein
MRKKPEHIIKGKTIIPISPVLHSKTKAMIRPEIAETIFLSRIGNKMVGIELIMMGFSFKLSCILYDVLKGFVLNQRIGK